MEKFIPQEKLSKRKKKELAKQKRVIWEGISPVTRKPQNPKAYKRKKTGRWVDDDQTSGFFNTTIFRKAN